MTLRNNGFSEPIAPPSSPGSDIEFAWGVKIPMRDGILLNATLYRPKDQKPVPAIFTLTPYIADSYHKRAYYFAQHGFTFATVDCRGRGNSDGTFEPMVNEGRDGYDIVEWLAAQEWCDGQVTMWGGSYSGFNQWMTLGESPPHLKTIVPVASAHAGIDFPFWKNISYAYTIQWLTLTSGVTGNSALFEEDRFWIEVFRQRFLNLLSFNQLDRLAGNLSTHFQTWVSHPTPDEYWQQMWLTPQQYHAINRQILSITGHYDADQPGALHYYRQHMQHGSPEGKAGHYLIIGPWDHAGTRTPSAEFGGLKLGPASLVDMNKLHEDWYNWTLKDGSKPEFLKDRVACYVMGAEEWRYAPDLESLSNDTMRMYLNSNNGSAKDVFHSGYLGAKPAADSVPDQYVYNPLDLRIAEFEKETVKEYLTDQRYDLNLFGAGVVFHSQPFQEATEITGQVKLTVWMAIDTPDADFRATLSVIFPDGRVINLTDDLMRARYRESLFNEKLVTPDEINCYVFDGFYFFSRRIDKGSRLRLTIRANHSIHSEINYNAGGVVALESGEDARTVTVTIIHDLQHPSLLELPVWREASPNNQI